MASASKGGDAQTTVPRESDKRTAYSRTPLQRSVKPPHLTVRSPTSLGLTDVTTRPVIGLRTSDHPAAGPLQQNVIASDGKLVPTWGKPAQLVARTATW